MSTEDTDNEALETVADYVSDARVLLQDVITPFRYPDSDLVTALNIALLEGRRLRPDLFVTRWGDKVPSFLVNDATEVLIEPSFRTAFVYGLAGHALTRDAEDYQDTRATSFLNLFSVILVGRQLYQVMGGAPAGRGTTQ